MKSIKDIDCRVVRENNGEVSILLGYPMENLVDMFSDMLEEPKENVRSWLRRELVPLTLKDAERLILCLTAAHNLAQEIKVAQDFSVQVMTADCECEEVWPEGLIPETDEVQPDDIRKDEMQAHEDAGKEVD